MKPFYYLCLGAILSSLLHELLIPISTTLLQIDGRIQREEGDDMNDKNRRTPKLADGCYHVFLDVGSNIGVHGRMLLEPHLYPKEIKPAARQQQQQQRRQPHQQLLQQRRRRRLKRQNSNTTTTTFENNDGQSTKFKFTTSARQFFTSQFGPEYNRIPTEYCIFAFEPNPIHAARQEALQAAYAAMGWRYQYIRAGVSDTNGSMTFYHVGRGDKLLERGFTTIESKCRTATNRRGTQKECPSTQVQVYRLSDWIDREIHGRSTTTTQSEITTSTTTTQTTLSPPKVVMKMDIEMAEWLVLPDLLTSGVLCRDVDAMLAEFHTGGRHEKEYPIHFAAPPPPQQQQLGGSNNTSTNSISWTLESYRDAEQLKNIMLNMIHHNPNCKTLVVEGDDESYGRDGMPLPSSSVSSSSAALIDSKK